jgi:hypothetical protein
VSSPTTRPRSLDDLVADLADRAGPRRIPEPIKAIDREPVPPLRHRLRGAAQLGSDRVVGVALGATQDDPAPHRQRL